ncbi:Uncharacterized protein HZ326_6949 [Fusarium oxysporum f. sp. albedinis]|nr:Uncharacterized protein HZ326_6949 [Fusarium oxysporum f. sp. albedinis]
MFDAQVPEHSWHFRVTMNVQVSLTLVAKGDSLSERWVGLQGASSWERCRAALATLLVGWGVGSGLGHDLLEDGWIEIDEPKQSMRRVREIPHHNMDACLPSETARLGVQGSSSATVCCRPTPRSTPKHKTPYDTEPLQLSGVSRPSRVLGIVHVRD